MNIILAVEATTLSTLLPENLPGLLGGDRVTKFWLLNLYWQPEFVLQRFKP